MGKWKKKFQKSWISLTIKKKIEILAKIVFLIVIISIAFDVWVVSFSLNDFQSILKDDSKSSQLLDALENESISFKEYIKISNKDNYETFLTDCLVTEETIKRLPFDYSKISVDRYAQTWSIINSYENYVKKRDEIINMPENSEGYIINLYDVYDMQSYLETYAKRLQKFTIEDGNAIYSEKVKWLSILPLIIFLVGATLFTFMISISRGMNRTIVAPIINLADAAKKIAKNDFYIEDVYVQNQDEIGDLIHAFNKMKFATGEYISALEEQRKMMDLIHLDELEKIETEKNLERINLLLLKSQINPHFLFNTLNVIGGMAKLEDADVTEEMIRMLSSIFRYNLKTPQNKVLLEKEIQVVDNYMYLQQMRFGKRISYQIECKVEENQVIVPTFLLQPLVENAILHGLSSKVEGGKIHIRIWEKKGLLNITVADTGVGITCEKLKRLKEQLEEKEHGKMGIGISNVSMRVKSLYKNGFLEIYSKKGVGTVLQIVIPVEKGEEDYVSDIDCR